MVSTRGLVAAAMLLLLTVISSAQETQQFSVDMSIPTSANNYQKLNTSTASTRQTFEDSVKSAVQSELSQASDVAVVALYPKSSAANIELGLLVSASSTNVPLVRDAIQSWVAASLPFATEIQNAMSTAFGTTLDGAVSTITKASPCRSGPQTQAPSTVVEACETVTSFDVFLAASANQFTIKQLLCEGMLLDQCDTQLSVTMAGATAQATLQNVNNGYARVLTIVNLIRSNAAGYAALGVQKLTLAGRVVYAIDERTLASLTGGGSVGAEEGCKKKDYWFLVFLILILPVSFIIIRHGFRRGKKKGQQQQKDKIKDDERELVHPRHIHHHKHQPLPAHQQQQQQQHGQGSRQQQYGQGHQQAAAQQPQRGYN